jgi:hypothetical protein
MVAVLFTHDCNPTPELPPTCSGYAGPPNQVEEVDEVEVDVEADASVIEVSWSTKSTVVVWPFSVSLLAMR